LPEKELDGLAPGDRLLLPLATDDSWRRFDAAKIARRGAVIRPAFPNDRAISEGLASD
jgi:hypothetical protein